MGQSFSFGRGNNTHSTIDSSENQRFFVTIYMYIMKATFVVIVALAAHLQFIQGAPQRSEPTSTIVLPISFGYDQSFLNYAGSTSSAERLVQGLARQGLWTPFTLLSPKVRFEIVRKIEVLDFVTNAEQFRFSPSNDLANLIDSRRGNEN